MVYFLSLCRGTVRLSSTLILVVGSALGVSSVPTCGRGMSCGDTSSSWKFPTFRCFLFHAMHSYSLPLITHPINSYTCPLPSPFDTMHLKSIYYFTPYLPMQSTLCSLPPEVGASIINGRFSLPNITNLPKIIIISL